MVTSSCSLSDQDEEHCLLVIMSCLKGGFMFSKDAIKLLVLSLCVMCSSVWAAGKYPASHNDKWSFSLKGAWLTGKSEGYTQVPAGGQPGTTTIGRPTMDELGYDRLSTFDIEMAANYGNHGLEFGVEPISYSGSTTLKADLVSQNNRFLQGEKVDGSLKLYLYRLSYLYHFKLGRRHQNSVVLSPGLGLVMMDFRYRLEGDSLLSDRTYRKTGIRAGGQVTWNLTRDFSVVAKGYVPIPLKNTAQHLSVGLEGVYQFYAGRKMSSSVFMGLGYQKFEYEDEQEIPNHTDVKLGPLLKTGLMLSF